MRDNERLKALKWARQRRLEELASRLESADPTVEPTPEQLKSSVELYDFAIRELSSKWSARVAPVAVSALAVGLVVSVLSVWPMPSVAFTLKLQASAASVVVAADSVVQDVSLKAPVRVLGQYSIGSPLLQAPADGQLHQAAMIRAEHTRLAAATVPKGASLEFAARPGLFSMTVQGRSGELDEQLEVSGATSVWEGASESQARKALIDNTFAVPETLLFRTGPQESAREAAGLGPSLALYSAGVAAAAQIQGLAPQSLRFVQRRPAVGTQSPFVSSLLGGEVVIVPTGARYKLGPEDVLEIDGIVSDRFELSVTPLIAVRASGKARRLNLRTGSFERSLLPSALEFAASNHRLALLWSGAAFLWGLLWSVQKLSA